ncbi:glycosyltransferase family 2 protein [Thiolapillus sp.]
MERNEYFISVIIPNYNYEKYIQEAIQSVLNQTFSNLEIVVVDDGSTDNSIQLIQEFGSQVNLVQQENQHLSAARNTGIKAARGKWVAFLDADDVWHPRKLEFQIDALKENPDWFFIGAQVLEEGEYPNYDSTNVVSREIRLCDFLVYSPMSGSDALVKKSCFDEVGLFDTGLRSSEDRDMWLRLASRYRGGVVEAPLWHYRQHAAQMNRNVQTMIVTRKKVIGRFFDTHDVPFSQRRVAWAQCLYDAALSHRGNGGSIFLALIYGIGSLLYAPESYHPKATTTRRVKFVVVTVLRLLRLSKEKPIE